MIPEKESRTRKAWSVSVKGLSDREVLYAPTASRARAQAVARLRDAWDIKWRTALGFIESVRRAPEADRRLPCRHPLTASLHPEILHCVVHAYGGTGLNAGWRDHFYTSEDDWELKAGLYHGLFRIHHRDRGQNGEVDRLMYELTDLGKNVARGEAETYPRW